MRPKRWTCSRTEPLPEITIATFASGTSTPSLSTFEVTIARYRPSEKPERMLFGLAYLEVLMNELCFDRHSVAAQQSREKIEDIILGLRESLGIPTSFSRQKAINIYWSTGQLLKLAQVEKLEIDEERKKNIDLIRLTKSSLRAALRKAQKNEN